MLANRKAIVCLCHDELTLRVRQLLLEHFGYEVLAVAAAEEVFRIIEETAEKAKGICPALVAVVLAGSRMRPNSHIDRFLRLDSPRDEWLSEIRSLFVRQDTANGRQVQRRGSVA